MAWEERISIITMFGCVMVLTLIVIVLIAMLLQERQNYAAHINLNSPFRSQVHFPMTQTNRLFNGYEDVDFVCISMTHRKASHYEPLRADLDRQGLQLSWFKGINGRKLNLDDYPMTPKYRLLFETNARQRQNGQTTTDYRGHLGCTLSHLNVLSQAENMLVILEDDAKLVPNFRQEFQNRLAAVNQVDPDWEVLLLGFCSGYEYHPNCKRNDREPIQAGGITRVHYWIGGWAYCVRNPQVAAKITSFFSPMPWHIDLTLADQAYQGNLRVYGCMPTIANHQGVLRISSWDFHQVGHALGLKSDTTNTIPEYVD